MSPYLSFRVGCKIKKEIGVKRLTQRTLLGEGDLSKFSQKPYLALTADAILKLSQEYCNVMHFVSLVTN